MSCWKTSFPPCGESISLEGENEATTTQRCSEFGDCARAKEKEQTTILFKSVNPIVNGLPLI